MIRRSTRIAVEILIGLFLLAAIPAAVLLWRLSSVPIELDFLTPYVETALEQALPNSSIEVGSTQLAWPGWGHSIDLRARDLGFRDLEGQIGVSLPEVSLRLNIQALFRGVVAPTSVRVEEASIYLVRKIDGGFSLDYGGGQGEGQFDDEGISLESLLARLTDEQQLDQPLMLLNRVLIENSVLFVIDQKLDSFWSLPLSRLELVRDPSGISGDISFGLGEGESFAEIATAFIYDKQSETLDLAATYQDVSPKLLGDALNFPEGLLSLDAHLEGSLVATLTGTASSFGSAGGSFRRPSRRGA